MYLGCIGDDFTGSSDLGNTLAKAGMRVVQYSGVPDRPADPSVQAGIVALKSRSIPVQDAVAQSLAALDSSETLTFYLLLLLTPANAVLALGDGLAIDLAASGALLLVMGILTAVAQYAIARAYSLADAAMPAMGCVLVPKTTQN